MCLFAELSTCSCIHSFFRLSIRVFIDSLVHSAVDWSVWSCRPQDIQRFFVGYLKLMDIFSGPEDGWVGLGQTHAPGQQLQPGAWIWLLKTYWDHKLPVLKKIDGIGGKIHQFFSDSVAIALPVTLFGDLQCWKWEGFRAPFAAWMVWSCNCLSFAFFHSNL